jgi:hypothetical protein
MRLPFHMYLLLLAILSGTVSCNRYIDRTATEKRISIYQGHFAFYPDSNILRFKSNVGISLDKESYRPKPFYVKLPKRLVQYRLSNAETFSFWYKHGQGIFILVDLKNGTEKSNQDSSYLPTIQDIEKFRTHFIEDAKERYNLWNIEYRDARKQLMLKKGSALILLYNIQPKNYDLFLGSIKGFEFI